jgi:hypothetical protein
LTFEISNDGLEFWLDRTSEIPSWSYRKIMDNKSSVQDEIYDLFVKPLEVEKQGNKTTIRVLTKEGDEIRNYKFYYGLGFPWLYRKSKVTYKPYFEV